MVVVVVRSTNYELQKFNLWEGKANLILKSDGNGNTNDYIGRRNWNYYTGMGGNWNKKPIIADLFCISCNIIQTTWNSATESDDAFDHW